MTPHRPGPPLSVPVGLAAGTALIVAAFFVPVEYTTTGGRTLEGWSLAMAGIAVAVAVASWGTAWRRAGVLAGLLLLGLAAQLVLTRPHWAMSVRITPGMLQRPEHWLAVAILAIQGLVALLLSLRDLRALLGFVLGALNPLRVVGATFVFVFCAANVAAMYPEVLERGYETELYGRWIVASGMIMTANLLLLWRIALAMPADGVGRIGSRVSAALSMPGYDGPARPLDGRFPWYVAGFVLLVTAFFARVVLQGTAQFGDEVVIQFMADVYARGRLGVPAPPVPEAFELYMVDVRDGVRYGLVIPGWPMVLAVGAFLGVPWLMNPVFGALSIPVAHSLASRLTDRGTANVVIVLLAASPWFLILSSVYQPHAVTLLAALLAWLGVHRTKVEGGYRWALAAGLAAGVAFSVRPMDGLVIGGAGGLYALFALGTRRASLPAVATYVLGCVATGAVSLWVNYALTGDPATYAMNDYFDREWGVGANRLGFGADVGQVWGVLDPIPGHGWRDVLFNLNLNFFMLNYELLGWGVGSLFLVTVHVLWGRITTMDRVWLAFIAGSIALYSLYWFGGGPDYGPRYWYSTLFPFVLLSAKGLATLVGLLRDRAPALTVGARVGVLVGLLAFSGVVVYGSWRSVSKYVDYRSKTPLIRELLDAGAFGDDGLVIVQADGEGEYAALELNDVIPGERGPVFARDLGPEVNAALAEAFADRPVYRLTLTVSQPEGKRVTVDSVPRAELVRPRS